jgi:arylsulfatase
VLIMVDDMGYSDIGCYGGEIPTPHIDALAAGGLRFSQFYNTARCCPTRASLMTGLHPHQTGIGGMTNSPKKISDPEKSAYGYTGFLNRDCVTIAEVLRDAGYHTYMAGKWHLGYHQQDRWPLQRGFERFYGIIPGACSYLWPHGDRGITHDNTPVTIEKNSGYYTTDAFTDHAIQFVEEQKDGKPFLLYLAYNAPHWPLHAKEEDISKFVGRHICGWDELRRRRLRRMIEMGLVNPQWGLSPRDGGARAWDELTDEQKKQLDYRMAVYSAQIHCVDYNIGRVVETLKRRGQFDNTLILFLSDNGGCAEPYKDLGGGAFEDINNPDKGGAISYGQGWANASNTPFRLFKVWVNEGGISTPLIAHWPAVITKQRGRITHDVGYLIDIMPTVLDVTGARYPTQYAGRRIHRLEGQSLAPAFKGEPVPQHEWMFWEHMGHCAVRHGKWKALKELRNEKWELYNLETDRCEMNDLAQSEPTLVKQMAERWQAWAERCHVLPKRWVKKDADGSESH